jgi:hypothetical protein
MGCGLLPKKVEYFQDKVQKMPAETPKQTEMQKEAAKYIENKTGEIIVEAVRENSSTNVLGPAVDAHVAAESLSGSLGKPQDDWKGTAKALADKLDRLDAKLDKKLEHFRKENDENAGKKIESTGIFQIGYFSNLLLIGAFLFAGWIIIKILGVLNPSVGIGTKVLSGGMAGVSKLVSRGFSEVVQAGESFKKKVDVEFEDPATREKIKSLFIQAHKENQSPDVQKAIKELTN